MTIHLTPEEFANALGDAPDARAVDHLSSCRACRDEVEALAAQMREVAAVEVPEPSPLFWDHFARRVQAATAEAPASSGWWAPRFVWTMGAVAVMAAMVVGLTWRSAGPGSGSVGDEPASVVEVGPVAFDDLADVFTAMAPDDVDVFAPGSATTWAMVDDLTDVERAVFVRLIERELEALP